MPDAGQTTDNALVGFWYVRVGDHVERGDVLLDVETDKATLPVESFTEGIILELKFMQGDQVNAGDVLALIGDEDDFITKSQEDSLIPSEKEETEVEEADLTRKETPDVPYDDKENLPLGSLPASSIKAMPNAKKLARNGNLDINAITPSNGVYIQASDVEAYLSKKSDKDISEDFTVFPLTSIRSAIGRRMLESVRNIPSFSASIKVNMREAIALKEMFLKERELQISFNDLLAKALSVTAKKLYMLNARFEDEEVRIYTHSHIGLAVSIETGLVVPVVRRVDLLGLREIAASNRSNIEKARAGNLLPDDMQGGTMTISNLGMFEISQFNAIINPPESSIYAIGKIEISPKWIDECWVPVPMMTITGTFDHRLIDGAYGAQVLQSVKRLIEMPSLMMV